MEGSLDFDKMTHTELLKSDVAKDRISVKPRARKASRQSRKKREVRHASFRHGCVWLCVCVCACICIVSLHQSVSFQDIFELEY